MPLALQGTLYSFTTVRVGTSDGRPRILGYVDLADGVRTLADIAAGSAPLTPDAPVEFCTDGDTWFFRLLGADPDNTKDSNQ